MDPAELTSRFTYHPPTATEPPIYEHIREEARALAHLLNRLCPDGREKSSAITHLEEVVFWANAAIARGPAK